LHTQDGFIHLSIKDDGAGFDIKQTYRGIGLSNIFERTRFYNGNVNIETSVGNGCTMSVTISVL
jgi:signal transduction histidine kinase